MSMKRLAVFSGASHGGYGGLNTTAMYPTPGSPHPPIHGVNVMLGGYVLCKFAIESLKIERDIRYQMS